MQEDVPYRFNIINCEKPKSQFSEGKIKDMQSHDIHMMITWNGGLAGMQPVLYSTTNRSWTRAGGNILYYRNKFSDISSNLRKVYYTLSFTITFPFAGDVCYIGYHYPYTYSMLRVSASGTS